MLGSFMKEKGLTNGGPETAFYSAYTSLFILGAMSPLIIAVVHMWNIATFKIDGECFLQEASTYLQRLPANLNASDILHSLSPTGTLIAGLMVASAIVTLATSNFLTALERAGDNAALISALDIFIVVYATGFDLSFGNVSSKELVTWKGLTLALIAVGAMWSIFQHEIDEAKTKRKGSAPPI
jgi:hypothetical protein